MSSRPPFDELFSRVQTFPDYEPQERLSRLIGMDEYKSRLTKMLGLLVNPASLERWAASYHKEATSLVRDFSRRPPLIVLAGDVGSGKSELAETIGDAVARQQGIEVTLFPMSLSTRGQGRVGEMTQLVSAAFDYTVDEAEKLKRSNGSAQGAVILLIDEADALAQSREASQMHHEDRAGVNAFIRGIDRIGTGRLPAAVIMCTNRLNALDPAVRRRAADILPFGRPDDMQRAAVLARPLKEAGLSDRQIGEIVKVTGPTAARDFGCTFSDLAQRYIPSVVLDAYPDSAISAERALEIARRFEPTPPFQDS